MSEFESGAATPASLENASPDGGKKAELDGGVSFDLLISLCKRRGFVFPGSEIYGGINALYDFGPLGVRLRRNIRQSWWNRMVERRGDIEPIETAIIMNREVWVASGHVGSFSDPLVECAACHRRWREDHLEDERRARGKTGAGCPECDGTLGESRKFNLMFRTFLGPVQDDLNEVFLRPETAQGQFVNFANILNSTRHSLPFGIAQTGKSFRNEISPGNFIFRSREFEQMEMEWFCEPGSDREWFEYWCDDRFAWYVDELGVRSARLRLRPHTREELSHYSAGTSDVEYLFPFGWGELEGIADRTDFDLGAHQQHSGKDLTYFDPATNRRFLPYVIETAVGVDRTLLVTLMDAYDEEEVRGEKRVLLRFHPAIAPFQLAILPLSKKPELTGLSLSLVERLRSRWSVDFDQTQSIGRRYRRQDEIGTPLAITVDFESLQDHAVTIRNRDTMAQVRVSIDRLEVAIGEQLAEAAQRVLARARGELPVN